MICIPDILRGQAPFEFLPYGQRKLLEEGSNSPVPMKICYGCDINVPYIAADAEVYDWTFFVEF